jgi:DNA-binding winged helix-turn-helix (wHTH) protein/tetratricopeptide (TPR) repeat protein
MNEMYQFGPFAADAVRRVLSRDGTPVSLSNKAFEVLIMLIQERHRVVEKEELLSRVWPDTIVEENNLTVAVSALRKALGEESSDRRYVVTVPGHGYRFAADVRVVSDVGTHHDLEVKPRPASEMSLGHRVRWLVVPALLAGIALGGFGYWAKHYFVRRLTDKDTIVLADFDNTTGDPVFDDTLKTALAVSLRQSPFLNILSDDRILATLQLMARPTNTVLTTDVTRELCQRAGSQAYIVGSIARLGTQYVLGLKAVNCQNGDTLGQEQVTAAAKEKVLDALGEAASKLRSQLGESLATVQKFDVPLAEATTSSLEALKAYSLGLRVSQGQEARAAIPYYRRAIELDSNFAQAYVSLGTLYAALLQEPGLAAENLRKGYDLQGRVSDRERFQITANYYLFVTGELDKNVQTLKSWIQAYPRDAYPHTSLGFIEGYRGRYEEEVKEELESLRLDPNQAIAYSNLMDGYVPLGRLQDARSVGHQALDRKLEGQFVRDDLYEIAFLEDDVEEMKRQAAAVAGKAGVEDILLSAESDTAAYYGQLARARDFSTRAVKSAIQAEEKETAALWQLNAALREAEFSNAQLARRGVSAGLAIASTRDVRTLAAVTLACVGDASRARGIAEDLQRQFPLNTMLNHYWIPVIRAYVDLRSGHPTATVKFLQEVGSYDLAYPLPQFTEGGTLYPAYVRGQAYLALHEGKEAAAEFQKFTDHRSVVVNFPLASLARLGLGRAYFLQGDIARAKAAYQDFLALWKDADPDIPILKQAKAEYAKLQ